MVRLDATRCASAQLIGWWFHLHAGMICSLYGGERGSIHDSRMFTETGATHDFETEIAGFGNRYCVYGDSGYGEDQVIRRQFCTAACMGDPAERFHNKVMYGARQCVESLQGNQHRFCLRRPKETDEALPEACQRFLSRCMFIGKLPQLFAA